MMDGWLAGLEARLPPSPIVRPPQRTAASQPKAVSVGNGKKREAVSRDRVQVTNLAVAPAPTRSSKTTPKTSRGPAGVETMPGPSSSRQRGKKSSGRKKATTSSKHQVVNNRNKRTRKLQPPKSAAVVVTVLPEAAGKGLTYAAVFKEARDTLASEFGSVGARLRLAQTGARVLEFPGADGAKTTDTFAQKLRSVLVESDGVRVARPTKCAEMSISDLDDSVSADDVRVAIRSKTGCSSENIRVGTIRPSQGGLSAVWVSCPVAAAKTLADAGEILVGFVNARVTILAARPM
ncbi:unnamed protein product, partial [Leptidea sinapis]